MSTQPARTASILLIASGAVLFGLNIWLGGSMNVALPILFMVLGGAFFILGQLLAGRWRLASTLFIPGALLVALGLVLLINELTGDWNAWAYAWLLLVAGIGIGLVLACRRLDWPAWVNLTAWGLAIGGVTFFAVFGAIAGGTFIQVMAPILVILAGVTLRWLRPGPILAGMLPVRGGMENEAGSTLQSTIAGDPLVETLSSRELEVLRLIDQGLTNQEIALRLHIAPSTVKTHINNSYGKLGVQTRVQALNGARELGLLGS